MSAWMWSVLVVALILVVLRLLNSRGFPAGHVGASAINNDDPVMLEAIELAKQTWPAFEKMYERRKLDSIVKFRFKAANGEVENVWGKVLNLGDDRLDVEICTLPFGGLPPGTTARVSVPKTEVIDWQIVEPDNTLLGGFTQVAVFKIMERETGVLPKNIAAELARYRSLPAEGEI